MILQELCRKRIEWDTSLTGSDLAAWDDWKSRINWLGTFKVPRWVLAGITNEWSSLQLHLFADASKIGYGAAAYERYVHETRGPVVHLMTAKARVAP